MSSIRFLFLSFTEKFKQKIITRILPTIYLSPWGTFAAGEWIYFHSAESESVSITLFVKLSNLKLAEINLTIPPVKRRKSYAFTVLFTLQIYIYHGNNKIFSRITHSYRERPIIGCSGLWRKNLWGAASHGLCEG